MTEPKPHTVSWTPSVIKEAVEHAVEAMKLSDGAYTRLSTFDLSALVDATQALIEHNERADAKEHSFEELADPSPGQPAEMAERRALRAQLDVARQRFTDTWRALDVEDKGDNAGFVEGVLAARGLLQHVLEGLGWPPVPSRRSGR